MADSRNINSEELEVTGKTGGKFFDSQIEGTSSRTEKAMGTGLLIASDTEEDRIDRGTSPTPLEISQKQYYDSQKRKNDATIAVLNVLKWLIPIFFSIVIGLLAFFGSVWAYKLNNIAEPIGGLKVEVQYSKENINELKSEIKNLQEKMKNQPIVK